MDSSSSDCRIPPARRLQSFPKSVRLRRRPEYLAVQETGRKVHSDYFLLLWLRRLEDSRNPGRFRLGITVSSRVGNAVVRNRLKRWIREYARTHEKDLPCGDLVVVAKIAASELEHVVVDRDLERLFARARTVVKER